MILANPLFKENLPVNTNKYQNVIQEKDRFLRQEREERSESKFIFSDDLKNKISKVSYVTSQNVDPRLKAEDKDNLQLLIESKLFGDNRITPQSPLKEISKVDTGYQAVQENGDRKERRAFKISSGISKNETSLPYQNQLAQNVQGILGGPRYLESPLILKKKDPKDFISQFGSLNRPITSFGKKPIIVETKKIASYQDIDMKMIPPPKIRRNTVQPNQYIRYTCPICLEEIQVYGGEPFKKLPNCRGLFHRSCLKMYILTAIQDRKFPVKCPDDGCEQIITWEVLLHLVGNEELARYKNQQKIAKIMANPENYMNCLTPDCKYVFRLPKHPNTNPQSQCIECRRSICLRCKVPYHFGLNCHEYRTYKPEDFELRDMLLKLQYKKCLKCRFWIEKNKGCNHITCICKNQFCYVCGKTWKTCNCKTED